MANDPQSWNIFSNIKVLPSFINYSNSNKKRKNLLKLIILIFSLMADLFHLDFFLPSKVRVMINSIKDADVIFSCGGGNFYSNTFLASDLILNLLTIIFAGIKNKPIVMLPQSFGPFKHKYHRLLVKLSLSFVKSILVREPVSYDLLKDLNIPNEKIRLTPDLALGLTVKKLEQSVTMDPCTHVKIGFTIIDRERQFSGFHHQNEYTDVIVRTIKQLLLDEQTSVFLFVQSYGPSEDQDDNIITTRIYQEFLDSKERVFLLNNYSKYDEILDDLSHMDILIASRMHTAIFGLINLTPTILIGYQPKAKGLYTMLGIETFYLSINNLNPNSLLEKINKINQDKSKFILTVKSQMPQIIENINSCLKEYDYISIN